MNRKKQALNLLNQNSLQNIKYLGEGKEGIVFADRTTIYKLYLLEDNTDSKIDLKKLFNKKNVFTESDFLFDLYDYYKINNIPILTYKYEKSNQIDFIEENEIIDFLSDCWIHKLIFLNIKKSNFRRNNNNQLKFIDYELSPFSDNLFLNMACRAFILYTYFDADNDHINKLNRSAINQFNLNELSGIQAFMNKLFVKIIWRSSKLGIDIYNNNNPFDEIIKNDENINLEHLFFDRINSNQYINKIDLSDIYINHKGYFSPKSFKLSYLKIQKPIESVSLLIKTCPQDTNTIYQQVLHIIRQLSCPNSFIEKVIVIDKRDKDFLREFNKKGTFQELLTIVRKLISEKIIDRFIVLPNQETIIETNKNWFNLDSTKTHTKAKAPVTPQLYAFDQMKGEYILQMDSDVMIGRSDFAHSFLNDMINEMKQNNGIISVGFNICHNPLMSFQPFFGFENGGFVPEIRMGLFHKQRLFNMKPLPNNIDEDGFLKQSWHRALFEKQIKTNYCSIRGGSAKSFFIHPQNYRKTNPDIIMTIMDRIESGVIPPCQYEEFDLAGSYCDWTIKKRSENLVIVCVFRNVEYSRFLRMWASLISQSFNDWGVILIDDASDNGLPLFINTIIKPYEDKVTFVRNKFRQGGLANTYKAIHYFVKNQDSIIVTLDGDDALLGNDVLVRISSKYKNDNADVVCGRMYRTDKLYPNYRYPVNFVNPRLTGGNVWQHIRSFKKYLFDSLDVWDLKMGVNKKTISKEKFTIKRSLETQWIDDCTDYAMMIPIIEMSSNPILLDEYTYFHERSTPRNEIIKKHKEDVIADIANREPKSLKNIFKKRKRFKPNTNIIEIDITFDCNLKCKSCNRSCSQAPSKDFMSIEQIKTFIVDSIKNRKKWKLINILGGEPTLHSDFQEIVRLICEKYVKKYSPETEIQIVSNGLTKSTRDLLNEVKNNYNVIIDYGSFKTSNQVEYFTPFNDAPIDNEKYKDADFSKGCWVTHSCGIGLNKYGYYACSVIGGIDRVIGKDIGIKSIDKFELITFEQQMKTYCKYCANFSYYEDNFGNFIPRNEKAPFKNLRVSKSWKYFYNQYSKLDLILTEVY